ncbi:MAG: SDR family oxidoreductase [Candidatus Schekmanbacteria bacterium]|nr:SDR family oxidoreductase [Candidatus Schekmanbacteria bacterium]
MAEQLSYLVTGATGLIGKQLVERLLRRGARLCLLLRASSLGPRGDLITMWRESAAQSGSSVEIWPGDVATPGLGTDVPPCSPDKLDHVFHLAALYDLAAPASELERVNVTGTANLIDYLRAGSFRGVFHHVSSVAVAGKHEGTFREADLELGQAQPTAYHASKYAAEKLARAAAGTALRCRIYRPSAVVGQASTGAMDRVDGPYFLFRAIRKMRDTLPRWFPLVAPAHGPINMVPVDYVAAALDYLAHKEGLDGETFHLVDPAPPRFLDTFNLFADAAGAPRLRRTLDASALSFIPGGPEWLGQLGSLRFIREQIYADLGIPTFLRDAVNDGVRFDTARVDAALAGSGIRCPAQHEYAPALWDYWLRHLDPDRKPDLRWRAAFAGKTVVITGASSGVGEALALRCAASGAHVLLVARRQAELQRVAELIRSTGGRASCYPADLSKLGACDDVAARITADHGAVDVLVNNAARSIRRPLRESLERFHDFERLMQLNYFAAVRLIRAFLPGMRRRRSGHVVNVLTAGVALPTPFFGAYGATKAALSHLTDTLAAEFLAENIHFGSVYLPFVRTPMMDATGVYEKTRAMTPETAAEWIMECVAGRKRHVMSFDTRRRWALNGLAPMTLTRILNVLFQIYDDENPNAAFALDRMLLQRFVKGRLM